MTPADMSDADLDHALAMASLNPMAYGSVNALRAEKARRRAAKSAPPREEPSQAANNNAAATEIAPDSEVGVKPAAKPRTWRDMTDEEMVAPLVDAPGGGVGVTPGDLNAYGQRYRQAVHNTIDRGVAARQEARAAGWQDPNQEAYDRATGLDRNERPIGTSYTRGPNGSAYAPLTDFGGGQTVTVDGVEVPAVDLGDGTLRYRLGDVKRAQEAADDKRIGDMVSKSAQEDLARYGSQQTFRYKRDENDSMIPKPGGGFEVEEIPTTELLGPDGKPDPALAQQQDRLRERRKIEGRQQSQDAALRNRPGLRQLEAREAAARDTYNYMAGLAGGSSGLRGGPGGNMGMLRALAMLRGVDPDNMTADQQAIAQNLPMDPLRAQVEARRWDMAGRLAGDVVTGALAGQGRNAMAESAQAAQNLDAAQGYFDNWHSGNVGPLSGPYTRARRDQMVNYLRLRFRLDLPTAEAIADSKPHVVAGGDPAEAPPSGGFGIPDGTAM